MSFIDDHNTYERLCMGLIFWSDVECSYTRMHGLWFNDIIKEPYLGCAIWSDLDQVQMRFICFLRQKFNRSDPDFSRRSDMDPCKTHPDPKHCLQPYFF